MLTPLSYWLTLMECPICLKKHRWPRVLWKWHFRQCVDFAPRQRTEDPEYRRVLEIYVFQNRQRRGLIVPARKETP